MYLTNLKVIGSFSVLKKDRINMAKFLVGLIFLFVSLSAKSQISDYKQLLDTALKTSLFNFVFIRPIRQISLDSSSMKEYYETFRRYNKAELDTLVLLQIFNNCKKMDTAEDVAKILKELEKSTEEKE